MRFTNQAFLVPILVAIFFCVPTLSQTIAPKAIKNPDPVYPPAAAEIALGGSVTVWIKVDKKGQVAVQRAFGPLAPCNQLGDKRIDQIQKAVVEAVKQSLFEPATKDGKPADAELMVTHRFDETGSPYRDRPASGKVVESGVLQGRIKYLARPNPSPSRIRGMVPVNVLVDLDGRIIAAGAIGGPPSLHFEAASAACRSALEPTILSGKPVKISGTITYVF